MFGKNRHEHTACWCILIREHFANAPFKNLNILREITRVKILPSRSIPHETQRAQYVSHSAWSCTTMFFVPALPGLSQISRYKLVWISTLPVTSSQIRLDRPKPHDGTNCAIPMKAMGTSMIKPPATNCAGCMKELGASMCFISNTSHTPSTGHGCR